VRTWGKGPGAFAPNIFLTITAEGIKGFVIAVSGVLVTGKIMGYTIFILKERGISHG
jgi:hypothetical protein